MGTRGMNRGLVVQAHTALSLLLCFLCVDGDRPAAPELGHELTIVNFYTGHEFVD
jgi:hypothetical protein